MTDAQCQEWRKYARGVGAKLGLKDEDLEDAEMEGLLKALELERDGKPVNGTSVGNAVRDWSRKVRLRKERNTRLDYLE